MTIELYQLDEYQETNAVEGDSATPRYQVSGETDEDTVRAYVKANLPSTYGDLALQLRGFTLQNLGGGLWDVAARYGQLEKSISWDTTGGQIKITQSLETTDRKAVDPSTGAALATIPDYGRAIGVTKEGVEGCEVFGPAEKISLTIKHYWAELPAGYLQYLKFIKGSVNQAPFAFSINGQDLTYEAGEILFLGTTGQQRGNDDIEITYQFATGDNNSGLTVGGWNGKGVTVVVTTAGGSTSCVQSVTPTGASGTYTLTLDHSGTTHTTAAIDRNATATAVETAINAALASFGLGVTVTVTGSSGGPYTVTFSDTFAWPAMTVNAASLVAGQVGEMTVNKGAWQYLWVRYADIEQTNSSGTAVATVKRATAAYVERVYADGDFSDLILE